MSEMDNNNNSEKEKDEAYCLFSKVFSNDLLREIILEHAIKKVDTKSQNPNYSIKDISCFRLSSKSFLETISKLLRKRDMELKCLTWMPGRLSDGKSILEKVVALFSSPDHLDQLSVLPFALRMYDPYLTKEEFQLLEDCLTHCSSSLASLIIELSPNVRMPTLNANTNNFPCLQALTIHIKWASNKPLKDEEETQPDENDIEDNVLYSVQTTLDGTEKLKSFELTSNTSNSYRSMSLIPDKLKNVQLPRTLTTLVLQAKHFDLLVRHELPKLNKLTICLCDDVSPIWMNQASEILEKYRDTLTLLELRDDTQVTAREHSNIRYVKLPLMEKLESLEIRTAHYSFVPSLNGIEKCLPNLISVVIDTMLANMWMGLLEHSRTFATVTRLELALTTSEEIEIDGETTDPGDYINLNGNQMRLTCKAFPNLQSLKVSINAEEMRILFCELRQLKKLSVYDYDCVSDAYEWTEVLLGITHEEFRRVELLCQESGHTWNDFEVHREENAVSILNLTELTFFEFKSNELFEDDKYLRYMVFYGGWMKIPTLSDLKLDCYFKTTPEIIQDWTDKRQGTTIDSLIPDDDNECRTADTEAGGGEREDDDEDDHALCYGDENDYELFW